MHVGFIGTGSMGNHMVRRLLKAGHQMAVYDTKKEATANLLKLGAKWEESPRAVAEASEVVFTCLPGPEEVIQVALDETEGILAGMSSGAYIDTSTNSPEVFRDIATRFQLRGIDVLDAPVSGGPPGAEQGTLSIMVGGDNLTLEKYRPLLESFGQNIFHMGDIGAGMSAKLVNQYLVYSNFLAAAEALVIGAKANLDLVKLTDLLANSGGNSVVLSFFPAFVLKGQYGTFTLDMALKDINLAAEFAENIEAPYEMLKTVARFLERGKTAGWQKEGFMICVRLLEELAGTRLRASEPDTKVI